MVLAESTTGEDPIYYLHGLDLVAQSDGSTTEYFERDGLESVRQLTDESGQVLYAQTFDPYGNVYLSAGSVVSTFGYAGEQLDENGLIFLRARYYDPGSGRFLNMDPSRQEVNPYGYVGGNPVMYTNPSGEICINGTYYDWLWPDWHCQKGSGIHQVREDTCEDNPVPEPSPTSPITEDDSVHVPFVPTLDPETATAQAEYYSIIRYSFYRGFLTFVIDGVVYCSRFAEFSRHYPQDNS